MTLNEVLEYAERNAPQRPFPVLFSRGTQGYVLLGHAPARDKIDEYVRTIIDELLFTSHKVATHISVGRVGHRWFYMCHA